MEDREIMSEENETVSETAPPFSLGDVTRTIMKKGLRGAIDDPEQGPHVHLTVLLILILIVSFLIILITQFI